MSSTPIKAQFVFGTVNTPQIPSYAIPTTEVLMPVVLSNGTSDEFSGTTSFNSTNNPYLISLPSSPSVSSAKIYVDLSINDNYYSDLSCITIGNIQEISNFILGTVTLASHQMVAADVNIDGEISIFDMIEIYYTILGVQNYFNNSIEVDGVVHSNVSAVYPTQNDLNQISTSGTSVQYTSMYEYNSFPSNSLIGQNFVAIKLGDVDNNCSSFFAFLDPRNNSYYCELEKSFVGKKG